MLGPFRARTCPRGGTSPASKHFLLALPTRGRRMWNRELVQNAKDEMIHQGLDRLRPMIEAGARRQNLRAGPRQLQKIFQMNCIVGRLSRHYDQLAAFLQRHISGPMNQISARPGRDSPEGAHRTWNDQHARLWMRARRGRRRHVIKPVPANQFRFSWQANPLVDFLLVGITQIKTELDHGHRFRGIRNDQVDAFNHAAGRQMNQRAMRVNRARGSGNGDC